MSDKREADPPAETPDAKRARVEGGDAMPQPPAAPAPVGSAPAAVQGAPPALSAREARIASQKEWHSKKGVRSDAPAPKPKLPTDTKPGLLQPGKKRPYALCFGYVGTGYCGLQVQPDKPTIEGDLLAAVHGAGGISEDNMAQGESGGPYQKVSWMRASRTDKGVHAVMNVVSLKLQEPEDPAAFVEQVNARLPPAIRVYSVRKTVGSFHAKNAVSHRYYKYVLPTFAFLDDFAAYFDESVAALELDASTAADEPEADDCSGDEAPTKKKRGGAAAAAAAAQERLVQERNTDVSRVGAYQSIDEALFERLRAYRLTDAVRAKVDEVLEEYVGTHYYHNYTRDKMPGDPSAQRYITEFKIERVEVLNGIEVATVSVKGSAFLMHQIRRMIGMAIGVYNAKLGPEYIRRSISRDHRQNVPTAPPTGLLLSRLLYETYDKKLAQLKANKSPGSDVLSPLDFSADDAHTEEMALRIRTEIMRQEMEGRVMACWIRTLPHLVNRYLKENIYERLAGLKEAAAATPPAQETATPVSDV